MSVEEDLLNSDEVTDASFSTASTDSLTLLSRFKIVSVTVAAFIIITLATRSRNRSVS